jgi:hypothetical protein
MGLFDIVRPKLFAILKAESLSMSISLFAVLLSPELDGFDRLLSFIALSLL